MIDQPEGTDPMIKTLLLICALGTPQAECSIDTAAAVIQGPDAMSLVECGLHGRHTSPTARSPAISTAPTTSRSAALGRRCLRRLADPERRAGARQRPAID